MFDIFKQDIKVGDRVKLYLITGKEPEGTVTAIGENDVLLQGDDNIQNRFFDRLIGGWDVILKVDEKIILSNNNKVEKPSDNEINQKYLLEKASLFQASINRNLLTRIVSPNADIIEVRGTTCIASNGNDPKMIIPNNKIVDENLVEEIEKFQSGSIIPVVLSKFQKNGKVIVNAAALSKSLEKYLNSLIYLLEKSEFQQANGLISIIRNEITHNKFLGELIRELSKIYKSGSTKEIKTIPVLEQGASQERIAFKRVEKEINVLIRESKFEFALSKINKELTSSSIDDKYKSSLLLKKAQIYSSINNPEASESAYQELVSFNEKINAPANNLSHLFTELARLQALNVGKQIQAVDSVRKALQYNPNNNFALNLLNQFEGKSTKREIKNVSKEKPDEHILIESDDESNALSKMIDLDIKEHKFSHAEVIKNGGKPTAYIAALILKDIRESGGYKITENYPSYLELAKAFSELNVGSYELKDYLESVAYYSMLKGNSLYNQFRNNLLNAQTEAKHLYRLNESAGDYYIETLNILSNIDSKSLIVVLTNYLQLKVARYYLESTLNYDYTKLFATKFTSLFNTCIYNKEDTIKSIAIKTIIDIGSNSFSMWNKLNGIFQSEIRFKAIFAKKSTKLLINNILNSGVDIELNASEFLKSIFNHQKGLILEFNSRINKFLQIDFTPTNFKSLQEEWQFLLRFNHLLQITDKEILAEIEIIILIIQPYLNRGEKERGNILYSVLKSIDNQIEFINLNTTFYGRTFYYRLLNKWRREVDNLLKEKIAQSYPSLLIAIDPPYYIETEGEITAALIITNIGDATAEGFTLKIICESTEFESKIEIPYDSEIEIASGSKIEMSFVIPPQILSDSKAVEISIIIEAKYQKKKIALKKFEFTVEEEPLSSLSYDDIPWRDGPITPEHLFKGRKKLIADLAQHYLSIERDKPYILYGLTRTGKSSVLEYLGRNIEGNTFYSKGRNMKVLTFSWDLSVAASFKKAADFWEYILYEQTFEEIEKYAKKYSFDISELKIKENTKAKDFRTIVEFLETKNFYPIFFVDEFSFIKTLIDDGVINSAFLHTLRQFSLSELASFIFAGTYDIKTLITDPKYGITGQLVHAISEQVNEIGNDAADELIEVISDKLSFTPEALNHIKFLSGNIPCFIQIICKFCGYYAAENNRRFIGYPELEKVVRILIGQDPSSPKSLVKQLPEFTFSNNQISPADPKEVAVLISSIVYFNKDRIVDPRGVGFGELQKLWADKKIHAFRPKLADAINLLKDKRIIVQEEDEGIPVYKLSVDLFRRWWANHNPDINLTLTTLTEE